MWGVGNVSTQLHYSLGNGYRQDEIEKNRLDFLAPNVGKIQAYYVNVFVHARE